MSEEQDNSAELSPDADATENDAAAELDTIIAERDKYKEQLYRTAADLENFRKRARRDAEEALRRGKEDTVREFLPVIDNLQRAVDAAEGATDVAAVVQGVQMVLRGFDDVAGRLGVARVPALGQKFDPTVHDAVQQLPTAEHEPGTVMAEVMPGYTMGEKLLRAAMVVVARPAPSSAEASDAADDEGPDTVDVDDVKEGAEDEDVHFIDDDTN